MRAMLRGEFPMTPPIMFAPVDVRDIARAHTHCITDERAHGRYLVCNPGCGSMHSYAVFLKSKYPTYPIPTKRMPLWLLRVVSWFNSRVDPAVVRRNSKPRSFNGQKIVQELGFKYQFGYELANPLEEFDPKKFPEGLQKTLTDTIDSFIKFGIDKKEKKK